MSALQDAFDAAKEEAPRISREFSRSIPEDPDLVFRNLREVVVEQATETQFIETRMRLIAQEIEKYVCDPEAIDRLRLIEAERIKAINAMKKCEEKLFKATMDFERVRDGRQEDLFEAAHRFRDQIEKFEQIGMNVSVETDGQAISLSVRRGMGARDA